jgi:uncharacterized membrane protein YfcA
LQPELCLFLLSLGFVGGFLSGLLGIGGGIIIVPLLLYAPPLFGLPAIAMKVVAGMTSVQSFVGAVSGAFGHNRYQRIMWPLVGYMGVPMAVTSLAGSLASKHLEDAVLLGAFAGMALAAAAMILLPGRIESHDPHPQDVHLCRPLAILAGLVIGVLSGIVGQGGAFLFIPTMLFVLAMPTRIAIGSALAIGVLSSFAVVIGRIGTDQVPWGWTLTLVVGVIAGARVGSVASQRTPRILLRRVLAVIISVTAGKIWWEIALAGG